MDKQSVEVPETTNTRLLKKNWSPLFVRKYIMKDWPMFVSLICDLNVDEIDELVNEAEEEFEFTEGIQNCRNFCGYLSDKIKDHYNGVKKNSVESVAVLWYVDKCFISSLTGDFMTHLPCKTELFLIINTLPHI